MQTEIKKEIKKHQKRRDYHQDMIDSLQAKLKPEKKLHVAKDAVCESCE